MLPNMVAWSRQDKVGSLVAWSLQGCRPRSGSSCLNAMSVSESESLWLLCFEALGFGSDEAGPRLDGVGQGPEFVVVNAGNGS